MADSIATVDGTHIQDLALLLEDARLLRVHAARIDKLPNGKFQDEFVRVFTALSDHIGRTAPLPPDDVAALERDLLGLQNQLAVALAPVTAESIRCTATARDPEKAFYPTVFAVAFSAAVFLLIVSMQVYSVIGKGLRDLIQQQDARRKELVLKQAANDDLLAPIRGNLINLASCELEALKLKKTSTDERIERAQQCARYRALREEEAKHELNRGPIARELAELQAQVRPASEVLTSWFRSVEELFGWEAWDLKKSEEIEQLNSSLTKAREKLEEVDAKDEKSANSEKSSRNEDWAKGQVERFLRRSSADNELRRVEQAYRTRTAENEEIRWRVLLHRFDILLQVVQSYILPALLGLLGALVFILRELAVRLRTWTYIPESWSNGTGRVVVGTMAGVLGGWFIPVSDSVARSIPLLALPFLLGYSVNILFSWLDKAVGLMSSPDPQPKP